MCSTVQPLILQYSSSKSRSWGRNIRLCEESPKAKRRRKKNGAEYLVLVGQ